MPTARDLTLYAVCTGAYDAASVAKRMDLTPARARRALAGLKGRGLLLSVPTPDGAEWGPTAAGRAEHVRRNATAFDRRAAAAIRSLVTA